MTNVPEKPAFFHRRKKSFGNKLQQNASIKRKIKYFTLISSFVYCNFNKNMLKKYPLVNDSLLSNIFVLFKEK